MSDRIFDDSEFIIERFACECGCQGHSLDIVVELSGDRLAGCSFNLYMAGKSSFLFRLKQAWKSFKGEDGQIADFIIRDEDVPKAIEILKRALTLIKE